MATRENKEMTEMKYRMEMEKTPEISGWINLTTLCESDH